MEVFHDEQYLNLVRDVLENGWSKDDRTGTGTISVFSREMRFNLANNTIPLLTTKKMHIRSILHELLWYIKGDTNVKYLQDNGVRIWNEWSSPAGHLNKVYGFQWRKWEDHNWQDTVVEIALRPHDGNNEPFVAPENDILIPEGNDELVGQRLTNSQGDQFVVIKKTSNDRNSKYLVQFCKTTSLVEVSHSNLRRGQVEDPYKKTVFGEGCKGVYEEKHPYHKHAYKLWYNMMRRCYDPSLPEYDSYGAEGVFVDQRWRCFANFLRDIHDIVYFSKWKENPNKYDLSKDYFGARCYSKTTCVFLPREYNQVLLKLNGRKYFATNKHTNETIEFTVPRWFARQHGIKHSQIISGETKDWKFETVEPRAGYAFRQRLFVDQLGKAIHTLRTNPMSRRIIVNSWNVSDLDRMALPPCHAFYQFYVADGKLSCKLTQRSCDVGLGVPFNIVQYSIFTLMVAQVTNLEPGEFVWSGGDVHIYKNHIRALREQTQRTPLASPQLKLNPDRKEIEEFTYDDFQIIGYEYWPTIKMEVSV